MSRSPGLVRISGVILYFSLPNIVKEQKDGPQLFMKPCGLKDSADVSAYAVAMKLSQNSVVWITAACLCSAVRRSKTVPSKLFMSTEGIKF
jgi:hypothetical protein